MADDYEVGYGKPPKHTRFKSGQSGNPGGRKAGSRGLKTDLAAELKARHTIQVNGRPVSGTRQQLALRTLAIRAASGDLKATQLLLPTIVQVLGIEDRGKAKEQLSAADQALLEEILNGSIDQDAAGQVLLEKPEGDGSGSGDVDEEDAS